MTRPPVVVIGLDCPTGLQTARTFAARGIDVTGLATNPEHACARTRSCRRVVEIEVGEAPLVEALMRLGPQLDGRAVVVPCTDLAVLAMSKHQAELRMLYRFAVPTIDVTALLLDKALFAKFATIHEFPIPKTFVIGGMDDIEIAGAELEYPCVLKPSVKSSAWTANTTAKAIVVESAKALSESYERYSRWADAFVVQEWIAGGDGDHYTCDCYVSAQGVPLVTFSARKIRQWPPSTGQGSLSVECRDDYVRELTLRVLATAGHHGQGYLETKRDTRSGRHLIVEANIGRPTGRAAAAERAGVELLMTMYCDLIGSPLPTARTQKYLGTKWIHVRRDLQASAHLVMSGKAGIREIVKPWRGPFAFALESRRDPVPFLADWAHAFGQVARSRWAGLRSRLARRRWLRWLEERERTGTEAQPALPAPPLAQQADFDVQGVVRVRTRDAWPADLAAVARHLGSATKPLVDDPDVIVCFVDELIPHVLEPVEDDIAFGDDGVYVLGRGGGRPLAHMRLSEPWGTALIVCRRGLGRVPLLATAIDLAALHHEWIPLRAQTWQMNGSNVLVVPGRSSRGGEHETRAARADCLRPVPEGRLLLSPDGRSTLRMGKATPIVGGTLREECDGPGGRADLIVLLEAHDLPDVTEITVERIDSEAAAGRIAAGIAGETRASLAQRDAQTGQLAGRGWISARRAPGVATRLLREATRWKPCYAIRHPASCTEEAISEAIARLLSEDAVSGKSAAGPQSKPRPEATAKPRAQTRRANNNPASSEKAQRHTRG
jgi:predicted ATP-grasp superfamily ATP-dependent carboligase